MRLLILTVSLVSVLACDRRHEKQRQESQITKKKTSELVITKMSRYEKVEMGRFVCISRESRTFGTGQLWCTSRLSEETQ